MPRDKAWALRGISEHSDNTRRDLETSCLPPFWLCSLKEGHTRNDKQIELHKQNNIEMQELQNLVMRLILIDLMTYQYLIRLGHVAQCLQVPSLRENGQLPFNLVEPLATITSR
jgi:hypothetical protein